MISSVTLWYMPSHSLELFAETAATRYTSSLTRAADVGVV